MPTVRSRLSPVVTRAMKKFSVPGVSIGLIVDGDEHHLAYGVTSVDNPLPVDDHTLFQIGSTTKTYTGTVLAMLIEEGKLDLEAPVVTYIPSFKLADKAATSSVLVRHLVTHTGGFLGDLFDDTGRGGDALRQLVRKLPKIAKQQTPVGTVWSYNNAGFYVLGRVIEEITKQSYEDAVTERILKPLGMDHSFWFAEDVITRKVALGHDTKPDGTNTTARPWGVTRGINPAGGLVSTSVDQMKYARFHLDGGKAADGTRVMPARAVRAMQKPLAPAGSLADHVGTTWLLEKIDGVKIVKHGGSINGHMSEFLMVPERGFAITILTNGSRGHELGTTVLNWALTELVGVTRPEPATRPFTAREADLYTGRYSMTLANLRLAQTSNGMVLTYELDPKVLEEAPEAAAALPPPMPVAMVGKDRAVVTGDFIKGSRLEFIRNGDSDVEWMRFGGRICKKVE
ncbi:MAG: beta-lactamase family protein [Actinobacteria bacterium]|nr:beta-lactamase family protein [Actinomycetota bacterium]